MSSRTVLAVILAGLVIRCAAAGPGPLSLDQQRRLAERNGFKLAAGPDAPTAEIAAPTFPADAVAAGAALFVRDYNLPIYPDSRTGQAELDASALVRVARGETEPLSIGVHALADLTELSVAVGPLGGPGGATLPADAVRVRYLEDAYIQGGWSRRRSSGAGPSAILAPLRLRPVQPLPLAKGVTRQFWIDVSPPDNAPAGDYVGRITVTSAGRPALTGPITVRVRPFRLDQPKEFFFGAFMSLMEPGAPSRQALADFKAHGIDGMLWFWNEGTNWHVRRDGETIKQDFAPLARIIDDAVAVGMAGPIVVALGNDHKGYYERRLCELFKRPLRPAEEVGGKTAEVAALDDELINRLYVEGVRQLGEFIKSKKGWPEVILLHYDEATERLMPEAEHRYKLIKQACPTMRVYGVTMNRLAWAEAVAPLSDILVCNGDFDGIRRLGEKLNKEVWGYGGSPASIGAGGARFNMGLRLWRYGLKAHWFWCYNFYPAGPWNEFEGRAGAATWVTVYPDRKPGDHVPTLAWEGIREGHDDIRYIVTLQNLLARKKGAARDEVAKGLEGFLKAIPDGRDRTVFRADQEDFYATLPSYHKLTELREQLARWVEQVLDAPDR